MTESPAPEPIEPEPVTPPSGSYDMSAFWRATVITVLVIAGVTWLIPFAGLLVPVVLVATLFFIRASNSPQRRGAVAGVLLGCGIGLLVTAGLCTAIFSGTLPSPTFPTNP